MPKKDNKKVKKNLYTVRSNGVRANPIKVKAGARYIKKKKLVDKTPPRYPPVRFQPIRAGKKKVVNKKKKVVNKKKKINAKAGAILKPYYPPVRYQIMKAGNK